VSDPAPASVATLPKTRRINRGRGHSYLLDGEPVLGVTTITDGGVPKPALVDWAARETAGYAVDHWEELAELTLSKRLRLLEKARYESSRGGAARGTDVHKLAQRLAAGEEITVPEELEGFVDSYLAFDKDWQPRELLVEVPVFHRRFRYAGTLDLIAELRDGRTALLDWKTGASGIWPETALQLAAYRFAEFWLGDDLAEHPLPEIDFAGAVWLRADGYDLYPVDASEATFRIFRYAQQIAAFGGEPRERFIGESLRPPSIFEAGE
jgi:hypothetical protein